MGLAESAGKEDPVELDSSPTLYAINEYQLRLDVQRFLWPVYYLFI